MKKIQKLVKTHTELVSLQKGDSGKEIKKREIFTKSLSELFDIMPIDVI